MFEAHVAQMQICVPSARSSQSQLAGPNKLVNRRSFDDDMYVTRCSHVLGLASIVQNGWPRGPN